MNEEEKRVLTTLADKICRNVTTVPQILTILQSKEIITDIDVQEIESRKTTYKQVKQLINILKTKRLDKEQVASGVKRPFEAFCFALQESGHKWLAEELTAELESQPILASGPGNVEKEPENELKGASSDDAHPNEAQNCAGMDDNNDDQLDDGNPSEPLVRKGTTCGRDTAVVHSPDACSDERNIIDSPPKIADTKDTKLRKR
uniref:CARD domain-containing protein n=1 Tax=Plectus sambesii TaxID=2011161 RepID=A0A914V563_9BILA